MVRLASKPGFTAGSIGVLLLLQLAVVRMALSANADSVYFRGEELGAVCSFKERFGVPCPTCGMTRSVVLTLHGEIAEASRINPGGMMAVIGLLLFTGTMFVLMCYQQSHTRSSIQAVERQIRLCTFAYGGLVIVVSIVHWFLGIR